MDWNDPALRQRVLDDLQAFAKRQGAIFVKLDPDVALGTGIPGTRKRLSSMTADRRWNSN